jgi:hypothetical protein
MHCAIRLDGFVLQRTGHRVYDLQCVLTTFFFLDLVLYVSNVLVMLVDREEVLSSQSGLMMFGSLHSDEPLVVEQSWCSCL